MMIMRRMIGISTPVMMGTSFLSAVASTESIVCSIILVIVSGTSSNSI